MERIREGDLPVYPDPGFKLDRGPTVIGEVSGLCSASSVWSPPVPSTCHRHQYGR
jgi:hypothetical protein